MKKYIVITTIGEPTEAIQSWIRRLRNEWTIVIVGDRKTPEAWTDAAVDFLSVSRQQELFPELSCLAPYDHYSRKNFGYLYAISQGAECILETDDDNFPIADFAQNLEIMVSAQLIGGERWVNVYKYFSEENIWPRGLPLDAIHNMGSILKSAYQARSPIQQFLVDEDPDVDAIWRLIFQKQSFSFARDGNPVMLDKGAFAPFNSQNTVFFPEAYPSMYLPHFVSFRMTDIWRSFVAQTAIWHHGGRLSFHHATAIQIRNEHNLMKDFDEEISGYLNNRSIGERLMSALSDLDSSRNSNIAETTLYLWQALIEHGCVAECEEPILKAWFSSLAKVMNNYNKG